MQLYICEKPSQAVDYAKALGIQDKNKSKGYFESSNIIVTWGYGHLLTTYQPSDYNDQYKNWNMEHLPIIPEQWKVRSEPKTAKQYKVIQGLIKKATEVVIATDADREGELIAVSILEENNFKGTRKRVWTGALDQKTLKKAIANMADASKTHPLFLAGLARQRADWLMGLNLTRGMTLANRGKVDGVMSVGRVQTPTLNLVYKRIKDIEEFVPVDYFELTCFFSNDKGKFDTKWQIPEQYLDLESKRYCLDKNVVEQIAAKIKNKTGVIEENNKTRKKDKQPLPYSLSSLQKEASSKFGFSAKDTLNIAQELYETFKATTYPRTDTQYLNVEQLNDSREVLDCILKTDPNNKEIKELIENADPKMKSHCWNDSKVTAHHAIIPTASRSDINKMNDKQKKIYDLVRRHYIAQFYPEAESDTTTIIVNCENEKFKATGNTPIKAGWKVVFPVKKNETDDLPPVEKGENVLADAPKTHAKKTQPPSYYTEGTLIDDMKDAKKFVTNEKIKKILKETKGIGTEATRGDIIATLFAREYLEVKNKKQIHITDKGKSVIELVPESAKSIDTTAYWESELENIVEGTNTLDKFLSSQEKALQKMFVDIKEGKCTSKEAVGMKYKCPNCENGIKRLKSKKTGKFFWACMDRDTCKTMLPDSRGKPGKPPEKVDQGTVEQFCDVCKTQLTRRSGQYGLYWTCGNQECKKIFKDVDGKPVDKNSAGDVDQGSVEHKCPADNEKLMRKKGPYGFYWNCAKCKTNYKEKDDAPILIVKAKATSDYTCNNCKKGKLVERKGKSGIFWGCNAFPKCKNIVNDEGGKPKGF